jgi:hypothetical protein
LNERLDIIVTMTQFPPPQPSQNPFPYVYGGAPQRTNGPAVASLVLGVLGCIPFLTGLLAILLGIIGIRKSRDPSVGGKGLAIAGLVLGIVSVLGWSGFGSVLGYAYLESRPAGVVAQQFLQDVSTGNISGATTNSVGLPSSQLQALNAELAPYGTLQSVSLSSFNLSDVNGRTTMHLGGIATFANGPKTCSFDLVKTGGTYKVTSCSVR